jgi:DNA-binding transcriptional regulator YhcF (GntR family)
MSLPGSRSVSTFIDDQTARIQKRLDSLRPLYKEYVDLNRALDVVESTISDALTRDRSATARVKRATRKTKAKARRGKRKAKRAVRGSRSQQTLEAIAEYPGASIRTLADTLGIEPNYLYRVTDRLRKDRKIKKKGKGFEVVGQPTSTPKSSAPKSTTRRSTKKPATKTAKKTVKKTAAKKPATARKTKTAK